MKHDFKNKINKAAVAGLSKMNAFTLSELLITLGVIGGVAVLTLPVVINKVQEKVLATQYEKSKSVLLNGFKMLKVQQKASTVSRFGFMNRCNSLTDKNCLSEEYKKIFKVVAESSSNLKAEQLPKEYSLEGTDQKSIFSWDKVPYIFRTNDGTTYGILSDEDLNSFSIVADMNGAKKPNIAGKDLYKFRYSGTGILTDVTSEIEQYSLCSVENLGECKTESECESLNNTTINGQCYRAEWISSYGGDYYCGFYRSSYSPCTGN